MSAAPQIQSVAQLRSTHGFTIVRLGSSQVAKKSTTPPLSSETILASVDSSSSNVQPISTSVPRDSLPPPTGPLAGRAGDPTMPSLAGRGGFTGGVSDAAVRHRPGAEASAGVSTPKTPPPTGGDDPSLRELQSSRGAVTSTSPDLDNPETVCLIGSDCYEPPYIPMMFYDEA